MFQQEKKSPKTRRLQQDQLLMISLIKWMIKMDNRPVLFIDSGLGGIPYAHFFHSHNRSEKLIYVADRENFPYGPKPKEKLVELLVSLVTNLVSIHNPQILVVACNTASVSALSALRGKFPALPIIGTVPAIKSAVLSSKKRIIGVLGTQRTLEDPYIADLAAQYGPDCVILKEAAPDLVDFVEHNWLAADNAERLNAVIPWVEKFRTNGADAMVLACTHFLLLLNEFRSAAESDLLVFDSVEGVSRRIEYILDEKSLRSNLETDAEAPLLLVTGERSNEDHWQRLADYFGFTLEVRF
jgi:glutamate racemase